MLNLKLIVLSVFAFISLNESRYQNQNHATIEPSYENIFLTNQQKGQNVPDKHQFIDEGRNFIDLQVLADALLNVDTQVHNAQNVINNIQRRSLNNLSSKIHYNYYDESYPPDEYENLRKQSHHHSKYRKRHRKKKNHFTSSDSDSGSDSDSSSSEAKPVRFEIVKHKKGLRQPSQPPPPPQSQPMFSVERDMSIENIEEKTTSKPKKVFSKELEYIQSHLRKITNKARRAGMRMDYFMPKRYYWQEKDYPKLGSLWFNSMNT